jgi:predicted  nucleic acid-binding Zn-ribbon protein
MSAIAIAAMTEELNRLKAARDNKESTVKLAEATIARTRADLARINKDIQELEFAMLLVTNRMEAAA